VLAGVVEAFDWPQVFLFEDADGSVGIDGGGGGLAVGPPVAALGACLHKRINDALKPEINTHHASLRCVCATRGVAAFTTDDGTKLTEQEGAGTKPLERGQNSGQKSKSKHHAGGFLFLLPCHDSTAEGFSQIWVKYFPVVVVVDAPHFVAVVTAVVGNEFDVSLQDL
jgi:hypothetical protein